MPIELLEHSILYEKSPEKTLDQLILAHDIRSICLDLIKEQAHASALRSHGLEPRNRVLLVGPPGNGKSALAEAIAEALMIPLLVVRYENIIGSYLGETANKLAKVFEFAKTRHCVLFFDEFETLGKERGDRHDTGEIKRVVSSLLLQIDSLPSHVLAIAATNHKSQLGRAAWRRFQIRIEIPQPKVAELELFLEQFEKKWEFRFGIPTDELAKRLPDISFAEAEEFALSILRQHILDSMDPLAITNKMIQAWDFQMKKPV